MGILASDRDLVQWPMRPGPPAGLGLLRRRDRTRRFLRITPYSPSYDWNSQVGDVIAVDLADNHLVTGHPDTTVTNYKNPSVHLSSSCVCDRTSILSGG